MKWLAAGLTFVNISTICGVFIGIASHGLSYNVALASAIIGLIAAILAFWGTRSSRLEPALADATIRPVAPAANATPTSAIRPFFDNISATFHRYRSFWLWLVVGVFVCFAIRSFCCVLFIDGNEYKIQSPNNLGDLSLHLTYINNFASGVPLWPENPIYCFSKLQYPAGIDLFNALLVCLHIDIIRGLVWVGILASAATCYTLYRWGGTFGIAAFLFNGGLAGLLFFRNFAFSDYQGGNFIAWKSLALSMLVTQRGLLFAIPVGLLLLIHWRAKYFPLNAPSNETQTSTGPLPWWVEFSLYATMPLFHIHTFMALSIVLGFLFLFRLRDSRARLQLALLVVASLLPATFFVWLVTDHFRAGSVLAWNPGWVQNDGDFSRPMAVFSTNPGASVQVSGFFGTLKQFIQFWTINFGITVPLILAVLIVLGVRTWRHRNDPAPARVYLIGFIGVLAVTVMIFACLLAYLSFGFSLILVLAMVPPVVAAIFILPANILLHGNWKQTIPISPSVAFVIPAVALFVFAYFVKTAPWAWDNIKIIIWAYLLVMPFVWTDLVSRWVFPVRALVCLALFFSGFVTLFGGIAAGKNGFGLANREEVDGVGAVVRQLPADARYAAFPIYNHPLLLQGRKLILGYPGHVWTQGFSSYGDTQSKLTSLMQGAPDWRDIARHFQARYLFWGNHEKTNYPQSKRPWEQECKLVATGSWGSIYDLESPKEASSSSPTATPTPAPSPATTQ
jgi:hypothetical protein